MSKPATTQMRKILMSSRSKCFSDRHWLKTTDYIPKKVMGKLESPTAAVKSFQKRNDS